MLFTAATTATTAVTVTVTVAKPAAGVVAVPGNKTLSICSLNVIRLYPSECFFQWKYRYIPEYSNI